MGFQPNFVLNVMRLPGHTLYAGEGGVSHTVFIFPYLLLHRLSLNPHFQLAKFDR